MGYIYMTRPYPMTLARELHGLHGEGCHSLRRKLKLKYAPNLEVEISAVTNNYQETSFQICLLLLQAILEVATKKPKKC